MSVDLIEHLEDSKGVSVTLDMSVRGYATLSLLGCETHERDEGPDSVSFRLPPTDEGLRAAEAIETGLREWRAAVVRLRVAGC